MPSNVSQPANREKNRPGGRKFTAHSRKRLTNGKTRRFASSLNGPKVGGNLSRSTTLMNRQRNTKSCGLSTSPSGAFRVVQLNVTPTGDDQSGQEFWIVSTRDESRR